VESRDITPGPIDRPARRGGVGLHGAALSLTRSGLRQCLDEPDDRKIRDATGKIVEVVRLGIGIDSAQRELMASVLGVSREWRIRGECGSVPGRGDGDIEVLEEGEQSVKTIRRIVDADVEIAGNRL
jgi:hypothetical protein